MRKNRQLSAAFYLQSVEDVARQLLGKVLVSEIDSVRTAGIITEVEAYSDINDAASHSARGKTSRNAAMWRSGGHWYVYQIYGLHACINVVTGPPQRGEAVLIRSIQPIEGAEYMKTRRKFHTNSPLKKLTNGPGNVAQALGVSLRQNETNILRSKELWIEDHGHIVQTLQQGARVGITKEVDKPWRFWTTEFSR